MTTSAEDLDRLGDEIATLSAHLDAATARLLTLIREFDARAGWAAHGCRTCAEWLSWRVGLEPGAARERVRVARALGDLPRLAAAPSAGSMPAPRASATRWSSTWMPPRWPIPTARAIRPGGRHPRSRGNVPATGL
jgi:Domain of unknown function (DUF222)